MFWGGRRERQSTILFTWYQGNMLSTWLTIVDVNLDHLAVVIFLRFLKLLNDSTTLPYCALWRKVTMHSPHKRSRELCIAVLCTQCVYLIILELCWYHGKVQGKKVFYNILIKFQSFSWPVSWGCDLHECFSNGIAFWFLCPLCPLLLFPVVAFPIYFLEALTHGLCFISP